MIRNSNGARSICHRNRVPPLQSERHMRRLTPFLTPLLFRCSGCDRPLSLGPFFPLCSLCANALRPGPRLCPCCGQASESCAPADCSRPWSASSAITGFHAAFLGVGQGYEILKRWKIRPGQLLDERIRSRIPQSILEEFSRSPVDAIVPVPPRFHRAWEMRGGAAPRIAAWMGHLLDVPVVEGLSTLPCSRNEARQAELGLEKRLTQAIRFGARKEILQALSRQARLLVVDDFMTSGSTVRAAAQTLVREGFGPVRVFCLALRPALFGAGLTGGRFDRYQGLGRDELAKMGSHLMESG